MKKLLNKKITLSLAILQTIVFFSLNLNAEEDISNKIIPSVDVKNLTGNVINSKDFDNGGKPIVIAFWATWCKPCLEELNAMSELYEQWQTETGVKIIAVSIDDSRTARKVAPLVKSRGWNFEIYLDENSSFKRAIGVSNPPHSFLLDGNKHIVYEHNGYAAGDEESLFEHIKNTIKK